METMPPDAVCISSYRTVIVKWLFPCAFFGGGMFFLVNGVLLVALSDDIYSGYGVILISLFQMVFCYFLLSKLSFQLMSQVWMTDDALIFVRGLRMVRVSMRNVAKIDFSESSSLGRAVLYLVQPCIWGSRIEFIPSGGSQRMLSLNPMVQELSRRLRETRKGGQERRATANSASSARASR